MKNHEPKNIDLHGFKLLSTDVGPDRILRLVDRAQSLVDEISECKRQIMINALLRMELSCDIAKRQTTAEDGP